MRTAPYLSAFRQSLSEAWANGAGAFLPLGFFAGTSILVPFTLGSESDVLSGIGLGVLWLALALASFVTLERVFQADLEDGALDLWVQEEASISLIALVKAIAHWLISGLPLVIFTPLLALMLGVPEDQVLTAMRAYAIGGLSFFLWGGVAAALAASVARAGLLIALIALPFYFPTLIFGALALQDGLGNTPDLLLVASCLFALGVAPPAMGAALRLAAD
ncbi:MAG: heme exporter protein CcmB [Pseudomonadota bacterium]